MYDKIEKELEAIEKLDDYEVIVDMENGEVSYERTNSPYSLQSIDSDELRSYLPSSYCEYVCVLCGHTKETHSTRHKFIACLEENRCIHCNRFFYEHPQTNTCYTPRVPVQMQPY